MKLLFSSDLHALMPAYRLFARTLAEGPWDAGVLAGDLLDDIRLPDEFLVRELGADPDDLLEDLAAPEDPSPWRTVGRRFNEINLQGLAILEGKFREVLGGAGKPVFLVPGNHDDTAWADGGRIVNLHGRRVEFGTWNFVGYRWTIDHRSEADLDREVRALAPRVDRKTILVTHSPPAGILDGRAELVHGIPALRDLVRDRDPRLHLFGHVHNRPGRRGRFVNGAWPHARSFWDIEVETRGIRRIPADVPVPNPRWA